MNKAEQLIACLEGEIAKRDARIVELEADLTGTQLRVLSLQDQWRKLDGELAAINAQEPVAFAFRYDDGSWHDVSATQHSAGMVSLYAAPVSEAKAQGVYSTDPLACSGCASGCFRCRDGAKAQGVVMPEREMPTEQELNSWFDRIDAALSSGKEVE